MDEKTPELAKALAAAQSELKPALKDAKNPHIGNSYADLTSVCSAVFAVLPKHSLSICQYYNTVEGKLVLVTRLMHASGEFLQGVCPLDVTVPTNREGKPTMNPMQALGSATSYARRYGISAIVGLTADDDDGCASSGNAGATAQTQIKKPQPLAAAQAPSKPATPAPAPSQAVPPAEKPDTSHCQTAVGVLAEVIEKSGKKKNGQDWTRYGVKIGDTTYGTFSATVGGLAKALKGYAIRLYYTKTEKGQDCVWVEKDDGAPADNVDPNMF